MQSKGMEARNVWLLCEGIECNSLYLEGEDPGTLLGFVRNLVSSICGIII